MEQTERKGKIITFYSYKGGTGRSMALANVAWVLASQGKRVLTIDWDLEAPGLHRYFHPFLVDKDLTASDGVIDFVYKFTTAASVPDPNRVSEKTSPGEGSNSDDNAKTGNVVDDEWYKPYTNILRYAASLDWDFKDKGTIDFIPAGRQGSSYATRINSFDWRFFYEKLGGGRLFELAKEKMRAEYDYILIDSRTGVSDTSGICTIQMPDILVVCFTLNNQGIDGTAAVAQDVFEKRSKPNAIEQNDPTNFENSSGPNGNIQIFPVPMRVENAEKKKVEARKIYARQKFKLFPNSLSETEREKYWGDVPCIYVPYYAYEEILAAFGDKATDRISILAASEQITSYITNGEVTNLEPPVEEERKRILRQFEGEVDSAAEDNRFAEEIFVGLSPDGQLQLQQLMLRLVRISQYGEVGGDALLRVNVEDIEASKIEILDVALRADLVHKETDEVYKGEFVKIARDSLINNWLRLREWIKQDQDFLLWRQKLQVKLGEWKEVKKDPGALLKGTPLEEALNWQETRRNDLNDSELSYIELSTVESQRLHEKIEAVETRIMEARSSSQQQVESITTLYEKSRRTTFIVAFISMLGVILSGLALYFFQKSAVPKSGEKSAELLKFSRSVTQPELSILLTIQAIRLDANEQSQAALREQLGKWRQQNVLRHKSAVFAAVYDPETKLIATAADKKIFLWSEQGAWKPDEIDTKQEQPRVICFKPDSPGRVFITGGVDGTISVSSAAEKSFITNIPFKNKVEITSLSYSPDGKRILVSTASNRLVLIEAASGREVASKTFKGGIRSAAFSPDGREIAAGGKSGDVLLYLNDLILELPFKFHSDEIQSVKFSSDSRYLVTASTDAKAAVWHDDPMKPTLVIDNDRIPLKDAEFSPDGSLIVTAGVDGKAKVFETATGKFLFELLGHEGPINDVKFIFDGNSILTASNDGTARIWNAIPVITVEGSTDDLISQACTKVTRNLTEQEWNLYMPNEEYQKTCENLPKGMETPRQGIVTTPGEPANTNAETANTNARPANTNDRPANTKAALILNTNRRGMTKK